MRFTLTYDGQLRSSGNSKTKQPLIREIRKQISEQLAELWQVHPALKSVNIHRWMPRTQGYAWSEAHHLNFKDAPSTPLNSNATDAFDICSSFKRGNSNFLPLVRESIGLVCALDIVFLRKGPKGRVYQGGDLDNRIKTLLDALRLPTEQEAAQDPNTANPQANPIHCLLEDDDRVTGLSVRTGQLLTRLGADESEVRLIIDADVRVTHPRSYNHVFLAD
jgi:hypothetical protein